MAAIRLPRSLLVLASTKLVRSSCHPFLHSRDYCAGEHFDRGWCFGWTMLHNEWTTFIEQKPTLGGCEVPAGKP
jgi:hypothetical protein